MLTKRAGVLYLPVYTVGVGGGSNGTSIYRVEALTGVNLTTAVLSSSGLDDFYPLQLLVPSESVNYM